jgi:murein DD-endopeptidase MepM/ murein hydrolase activator NlpD
MANPTVAYKSSISVSNIRRSVSSLGKGIKRAQGSALSLSQSLSRRNETKRQGISTRASLFQKRQEAVRRREQEDIVEASGVTGAIRRTRKVVMNSTKGFLGRILDYIGTLLVGWALVNLPTIIRLGEELINRIQKLTKVMSTFIRDTTQFLFGFGQLLDGVTRNLISFDFTDSQGRVAKAMETMQSSFRRMEVSIFEGLRILTEPIDFETEKDAGEPSAEPTLPGPIPTSPTQGQTSDFWTLVAVASREDGDPQGQADVAQSIYNRAASGAYGSKNIRELILRREQYQPTWDYPRKGKYGTPNKEWYQITDAESAARAAGFDVNTIKGVANNLLNKTLQKKAAEFVQGRTDFKGYDVPGSIQRKSGDNWFGWEYTYRGKTTAGVPEFGYTPGAAAPSPARTGALRSGDVLTDSIGRGVQFIQIGDVMGAPRGGGRKHAGIDIQCPANTCIALRLDCEVMFAGWQNPADHGSGYGLVIDVWVPELGVQLRFGHCAGFFITNGKVPAGRSFARVGSTGASTGPHIHFEYTRQRGSSAGGSDSDPSPYVPYILLTNKPNYSAFTVPGKGRISAAPAQISVEQGRDVKELKREKKDNVLMVPLPQSAQRKPAIIPMSGGDMGLSVDDSLNRFVAQKMLLDLAYS